MQQQDGFYTKLAAWFIDSPLIAVMLFAVALATAAGLVRFVPLINRTVTVVESNRHSAIDGLRGILGISVFIHHTVITWFLLHGHGWEVPPSRFIAHLGQTSVALFFMITAFLFWGRVLDRGAEIDWPALLVSRLYRLYPVYLLMLGLLITAVVALALPGNRGPLVRPLLDWLLFTMFGAPDLNGLPQTSMLVASVTWSLRFEWLFYLALPLIGFVAGQSRQPLAALFSAVAIIAIFYHLHWRNTFDLGILQAFLGGILAAHWVRNPTLTNFGHTLAFGMAAIAALSAVVLFVSTAYTWKATIGLTLFFTIVASGNDLWGILKLPGLLWLGDITYSIYLLHGLLLWVVFQHLLPREIAAMWPVFLGVVVAVDVMLVLICSIVFLTVERPAILAGKRHYHRFESVFTGRFAR